MNIGYPINEVNRINFGLTYANVELSSDNTQFEQTSRFYDQFRSQDDPDSAIKYQSFLASASWTRSTLNRGLFPTDGSSQRASFSITTPNSDVNYFKLIADTKFYFPISQNQRWSLLARMRVGYGNGYGDKNGTDQILPFTENFTAGGADTLRGFEDNTVGPRGVQRSSSQIGTTPSGTPIFGSPDSDSVISSARSLGGNAMAIGGLELIVPTPFIEADFDSSVRTSIFFDIGNVWDTEFNYDEYKDLRFIARSGAGQPEAIGDYSDWSQFRSSAGLSVQWISPMGPLVFSFSKEINARDGDNPKFFTFNIGSTF
jgi:outer membrane protein insertion porin family